MIKLVRVDHRLVHGQVAFSWTKFLGINCILIASDELQKDDLKMAGLRMAIPSNVKLVMKGIEDSAKALNSGVTDKYSLMILCESVKDVYLLIQKTSCIKAVNLGGTKAGEDRKQISKAVHVTDNDMEIIRKMDSMKITVDIQLVPDDPKSDALKLF